MNSKEELKISLLSIILECWWRDVDFLCDLLIHAKKKCIDIDLYELREEAKDLWSESIDVNSYIYLAYQQISKVFIDSLPSELIDKASDTEEIYCNYTDSHLWYGDEAINDKREKSKYHF